ncbi:MAG: DEAD/DEAH box helicase [Candidatus Desulforudaceae bacterium]|nr:DEAD/DEAH box helicase [Clostridia bacterium]
MLYLTIDSRIRFVLPPETRQRWPGFLNLKADMVISNPAYAQAEKHGRYTGGIDPTISLWHFDRASNTMSVPRGYGQVLTALLRMYGISWQVAADNRVLRDPVDFGSKIQLRDYQDPAVEAALRATGGVLVAPAGSGKTQMGLEIIARLRQPALWLTHTLDLAEQAINRAAENLSLTQTEIGMVGAGRHRIGNRLTIGIIQTLINMDLSELAGRFGTVIVDEVHHGSAPTWQAVINQLPARYRFGLTATPKRADGLEIITTRVLGPVCSEVPRSAVKDASGIITPRLRTINTGIESQVWRRHEERMADYQKRAAELKLQGKAVPKTPLMPFGAILDELLSSEKRNKLIVETLLTECPGHYSLVLSKRVEHCLELAYLLNKTELDRGIRPRLRTSVIHGGLAKKVRANILELAQAGKCDILFAVEIAKEGLDIPRLDRLFLVGGGRDENATEQQVGRIQRPWPGKVDAVVFDFVDELIPPMRAQHWARRKVYRRLGTVPAGQGGERKRASG